MTEPPAPRRPYVNPMQVVYDIIITFMETLGLFLVAFGLGGFASWIAGTPGFLFITGLALLGAATLSARRQQSLAPQALAPRAPGTTLPNWPPTRNATPATNSNEPTVETPRTRTRRVIDWIYAGSSYA